MANRRTFLRQSAGLLSLSALPQLALSADLRAQLDRTSAQSPEETAQDEAFWGSVREAYSTSSTLINLNNGGVSPAPIPVQEALERYNAMCNEIPSYYMWQVLDKGRERLRQKLADLAGCDRDEICVNRNTTEALETVIFGIDLAKGDEVLVTKQDYPNMLNAWKQRARREGIVVKEINLELPTEDVDYLVKKYTEQITPKTRVVQVNHIINWTGHINPVRAIADAVHAKGPDVMIDGAHTFGHFEFNIPELGGDYFGTSLHKWLCAPFGSGMLWIKKEKIAGIWPLFAAPEDADIHDIRKFEHLGTRSFPIEYAVADAVDFEYMIGPAKKEARLRFLKDYWVKQCTALPKFRLNTSLNPSFSCAIANFGIDGMETGDIASRLFTDYSIHTVAINWENIHGVRVAPNVYTALRELDVLVKAIHNMAS